MVTVYEDQGRNFEGNLCGDTLAIGGNTLFSYITVADLSRQDRAKHFEGEAFGERSNEFFPFCGRRQCRTAITLYHVRHLDISSLRLHERYSVWNSLPASDHMPLVVFDFAMAVM